jgi:hypothetical protein
MTLRLTKYQSDDEMKQDEMGWVICHARRTTEMYVDFWRENQKERDQLEDDLGCSLCMVIDLYLVSCMWVLCSTLYHYHLLLFVIF